MWETWVWSLGWDNSLKKEMDTHSSILSWRILWTEESGGLESIRSQRVGHEWVTNTFTWTFFRIGMKINILICWHIQYNSLIASSFRIRNSSARIPSPPLALFIVMLPKVHLTSCSRMSGSRWMTTPTWLSNTDLLCILATSSQSLLLLLGPYSFYPLLCPSFHEMVHDASNFLEEILTFPILLFSSIWIVHLRRPSLSSSYSLEVCIGYVVVLITQLCLILATPWTVTHQAPLSMEFSRQEYWSGLPFPSPGDLPDPGIEGVSCIAG